MTDQGKNKEYPPTQFNSLSLNAFRNYADADLELDSGLTLIVGPNGHGKTNLVEAIYYLCLGHSFRERIDRRLIMFDAPRTELCGRVEGKGRDHEVEISWSRSGSKKVRVDGVGLERISDLVGRVPAVSLTPEDGTVVYGEPGARRRFMDIVLAQTDRGYLEALKQYRRALKQRNLSLRAGRLKLAEVYEKPLVDSAVEIRRRRKSLIDYIGANAVRIYRDISGRVELFGLRYNPNPALEENDDEAIGGALADTRPLDLERGHTGTGPHRDDVEMEIDGRELRTYGSHGQARTSLATLKISEVGYYSEIQDRRPVLIMDEVTAVMDRGRAENLIQMLSGMSSQVFLTSPSIADLGVVAETAGSIVEVREGELRKKR